jgi:hypothetical protein
VFWKKVYELYYDLLLTQILRQPEIDKLMKQQSTSTPYEAIEKTINILTSDRIDLLLSVDAIFNIVREYVNTSIDNITKDKTIMLRNMNLTIQTLVEEAINKEIKPNLLNALKRRHEKELAEKEEEK